MNDVLEIYTADVMRHAAGDSTLATSPRDERERLILENLRLVYKVAMKYMGRGLSLEELIQAGNFGLIQASKSFDPTRGVKFCTYAYPAISQFIRREIVSSSGTIRIPENAFRYTTVPPHVLHGEIRSLDFTPKNHPGRSLGSLLQATETTENPFAEITPAALAAAIATLGPREQFIITNRFGLHGPAQTLGQLSRQMDPPVSKEAVRQLQCRALKKLRYRLTMKEAAA